MPRGVASGELTVDLARPRSRSTKATVVYPGGRTTFAKEQQGDGSVITTITTDHDANSVVDQPRQSAGRFGRQTWTMRIVARITGAAVTAAMRRVAA